MTARAVIPLQDHPDGRHRDSVLVSGPRYTGFDIYRTRGRFLATLPGGMAIAGLFESQAAAEAAQATHAGPGAAAPA